MYTGIGEIGMHNCHGGFRITSDPNWQPDYSRGFISFQPDMSIICYPSLTVIGQYSIGEWVKIKIDYQILNNSVKINYYINNILVKEEQDNLMPGENDLKYITIESCDTKCLVDDISVRYLIP